MRGHRETDPAFDHAPEPAEVGDIVKVYNSGNGQLYYMLGRVESYDEQMDQYTVWCYNRGGEPIKTTASANRVDLVDKRMERVKSLIP